jgi:hypothetical protein
VRPLRRLKLKVAWFRSEKASSENRRVIVARPPSRFLAMKRHVPRSTLTSAI